MKKPRTEHHRINLSNLDFASVTFTDDKGSELLNLNFDRTADEKPTVTVNASGKNGDTHAGFVLFDMVA